MTKKLELLSPAKNLEQGKAAINHGADAVYIGAPLFGARVAAGNSIEDIEELVKYAHIFGSKVFATVNTLLFDNELEDARRLMWQLYNAGVDAAIVQDMGLLELDLPPIELHASTQTHNYDPRRIKFLEQVGFKRIILARETSLEQMKALRETITADLEAFIQGALCVCYSGQCYMSLYLNGRSGNRGSCSQPCRSAYDLINEQGKTLKHNAHLLSLKDFSAAQHLEGMIDAGITSFKIEGRLKDISYVKNVTAYYRQIIDGIIARREGLKPSSSGRTTFLFTPDLERTFTRGFTDYFLQKRQPMASTTTQKSLGKKIGPVISCNGNQLTINTKEALTAGDGLCYFNDENQLEGFLVNNVAGNKITANKALNLNKGITLWRNNDFAFEKQLQGDSSRRKISVSMTLDEIATGLQLTIKDNDGCSATATIDCEKTAARDEAKATETIKTQLSKLGGTAFEISDLKIETSQTFFIPSSQLNELRRNAVEQLIQERIQHFHPKDTVFIPNEIPYFETHLDGRANIVNDNAEAFYRRHSVTVIERGPDQPNNTFKPDFPLMTTKYCLRYELGQCLMHKCNKNIDKDYLNELYLINNGNRLHLHFDCKQCEMKIFANKNK
ncbi:MAG: U32 family peptidase [Bacteroidales bacterium]|nr:U32 family peptidase [Bacteroidales bacterium]